jgi:hypothetical protein
MFSGLAVSILGLCISVFSSCADSTPRATHMYYVNEQISEVLTVDSIRQIKQGEVIVTFHNSDNQRLDASVNGDLGGALPLLHHAFSVTGEVASLAPVIQIDNVVLVAGK